MNHARPLPLTFAVLFALSMQAQVRSDRSILLEGVADEDRAVQGIGDAAVEGDALNARTLQAGGFRFAQAAWTGDAWSVSLDPPVGILSPGLRLSVLASADNEGPVTLNVDGTGDRPLLGAGGALSAGDVLAGEVLSVVYDGAAFQLISGRPLQRKPCPPGTVAPSALYCIETVQHDTTDYPSAAVFCGNQNMQLCTWGQWYVACTQAAALGLQGMVGDWEWTNSAGNSDIQARVVGQSTCTQAAVTNGWDSEPRSFRCCYRR